MQIPYDHSSLQLLRINLIGMLGAWTLRAINVTLRWDRSGIDETKSVWAHEDPRIIAFWHSRQLFMPFVYRSALSKSGDRHMAALGSKHADGRIMARALQSLGIDSIPGSSSQGGLQALHALVRKLKNGSHIAITPDGPKGPLCKVKMGVVKIAQVSGAAIYPMAIGSQRKWRFGSWDRMQLPIPFSRAVRLMGEPIKVPPKLNEQEFAGYVQELEDKLNALTARADTYFDSSVRTSD